MRGGGREEERRGEAKSSHVIGRRRNNTGRRVSVVHHTNGTERNGTEPAYYTNTSGVRSSKKCEGVAVWRPANE